MKLFDKFKKVFGVEKPPPTSDVVVAPDIPIKPGPQMIRSLRTLFKGFRFKARTRIYKKRKPPIRFIKGKKVVMSFRQARLHDIYTSMREANEVRRFTRERQLEARAERAVA